MDKIAIAFIIFILYSFLGWCMEVILKLIEKNKFVNRGFLIGPLCPIYGCGALCMLWLLTPYKDDTFVLIVMATFVCSVLEYITSYIMEKIFKARWWDYSNKSFNINGRICLFNAFAFGVLGYLLVKIITPYIYVKIKLVDINIIYIISGILFIIYVADTIISTLIMLNFKTKTYELKKDNTEEITEKVRTEFLKGSYYKKRLIEAFPNVHETLKLKVSEIEKKKKEAEKAILKRIEIIKKILESRKERIPVEFSLEEFTKYIECKKIEIKAAIEAQGKKNQLMKIEFIQSLEEHKSRFKAINIKEKIVEKMTNKNDEN